MKVYLLSRAENSDNSENLAICDLFKKVSEQPIEGEELSDEQALVIAS